jgi:hypothetical protein
LAELVVFEVVGPQLEPPPAALPEPVESLVPLEPVPAPAPPVAEPLLDPLEPVLAPPLVPPAPLPPPELD